MANIKSAIKRVRQTAKRRLSNRYDSKTARNAIKKFISITSREEAMKALPAITSQVDKLAKKNIIHKKNAGNLKSRLNRHVNRLK